jgi:peptide/nickel transport system permease protein
VSFPAFAEPVSELAADGPVRGVMLRRALRYPRTRIGLAMTSAIALLVAIGPLVRPHSPTAFLAAPYARPSSAFPLGADSLGRDVLSQVLSGGLTILLESIAATVVGVGLGVAFGMATGYSRSRLSGVFVRLNDTALALPQTVLTLLVLTRIGAGAWSLILVVAAFHVPLTARVIRVATLRVVHEDFVSAVEAMGASRARVISREILPNVSSACFVEVGIRLAISVVVLASLGYLGFGGLDIDWGRMIYDNQGGLTIQPWGVLAPAAVMGCFLIGISLLTDGFARAARRDGSVPVS